jgi:superfamily II DNA/RNA helicase
MFQTLLTIPRANSASATIRGIVIAPTRELAVQISNDALSRRRSTRPEDCLRVRRAWTSKTAARQFERAPTS